MDAEIYRGFLDPAIEFLEELLQDKSYVYVDVIRIISDLKFLKMLVWGLAYWKESEYELHLRSAIDGMVSKVSQLGKEFEIGREHVKQHGKHRINWVEMRYGLKEKIKEFKAEAKEFCTLLLDDAFSVAKDPSKHNKEFFSEYGKGSSSSFIDFVLLNLNDLLRFNSDLIVPVKQQIASIQWELQEFRRIYDPSCHWMTSAGVEKLQELVTNTQTCAVYHSCLACLYWIDGNSQSFASITEAILRDLKQKTMPYPPGIIALYLEDKMIHQFLGGYFDFLLQDLDIPETRDVEMLREGIIFLLSFAIDPPEEESEYRELILAQVYTIINELSSFISSIRSIEAKESSSNADCSGFLKKINNAKTEVQKLCVMTPEALQLESPKTNPFGYLDLLLKKLGKLLEAEDNLIRSVKSQVEVLKKELAFLKPFLQGSIGQQNEQMELKDLHNRTIDVVYYAAYITNFCQAKSFRVWYGITGLPTIMENIKCINDEIHKLEGNHVYNKETLNAQMESSIVLGTQGTTSKVQGTFVGFKDDAKTIIDWLTSGQRSQNSLTIISISGMPGQGKSTLARRVYNDPRTQYHFQKLVWCYVSKECKAKELLIRIGNDLIPDANVDPDDLPERLRKSLKGQNYLLVLDDIWDVAVWDQLQPYFPDDSNGSRILFTTRIDDLASQAKTKSISHRLRLFTEDEGLDLMDKKLDLHSLEKGYLEIVKEVVTYCKGLPLALALTAAILERTKLNLYLWKELAENIKSHLAGEGCGSIIELSYKYLSDHLKPCFLYFGAFPRGENVSAKKLKLLWFSEGFIKDNGLSSSDVANEYLNNLVSQSLIVVTERNSKGGVKICNVHDLLYDMCLEKGKEESFLLRSEKRSVMDGWDSFPRKYSHHLVSIGTVDPFIKSGPVCTRMELPTSQVHSLVWFQLGDSPDEPTYEFGLWFYKSFLILTVLDLDGVDLKCDKFPRFIFTMIHLKYLALKMSGRIDGIPPLISDLLNLETLSVRAKRFSDPLPISMWKMKSLRHVEVPAARIHLEDFDENDSFVESNIEKLGTLHVGCDSKTEAFLKKFSKLKKLACYFDKEEVPYSSWFSMFASFTQLESLQINRSLDWLVLKKEFPTFNFDENLKKLTLSGLRLPWSALSTIGEQLPNIRVLKLINDTFVGSIWNLEDGQLSELVYLKLSDLGVEEIDESECDDPFPSLEQLVVEGCYKLKELPSCLGQSPTLRTIRIIGCSPEAKESVGRILEEQRGTGNDELQIFTTERYRSNIYKMEILPVSF